jgi:hypothetical protein
MSRFELPYEATILLHDVRRVSEQAEKIRHDLERDLTRAREEIAKQKAESEQAYEAVMTLLESRVKGFELIANAWNDYEIARSRAQASALRRKKHPAKKAADEVRAKGRELAEARRRAKIAEWVLALYEWHFPWLAELRDLEWERSYIERVKADGDAPEADRADPVSHWLTAEEFAALDSAERNQRALDRYLASRKSAWEVGRDYERYVGYLREQAGAAVTYHGIFKGLEDLGRDLLAQRGNEIEVIQCKRWARERVIHEKHVFQLFGTVVAMRIENPGKRVIGTFTTTTSLSERAREFARELNIRVEENLPLQDYPRIKCNIGRRTGERIYHLPFDQQYDTTTIEPERDERYAATVAQAEAAGFRRAWRWQGEKASSST